MFDNLFSTTEIANLVQKKFGHNDFKLLSFSIKPVSDTAIGYLGEHLRVKSEVKLSDKVEIVLFFVKKKLENSEAAPLALLCLNSNVFEREALFLLLLQKEQPNVKWAPKLYGYKNENTLIFEDLSERKFEMTKNEFGMLDFKHCKMGLNTLAKMHAFSFQYQYKKLITNDGYSMMDEFSELFDEVLFHKEDEYGKGESSKGRVSTRNFVSLK